MKTWVRRGLKITVWMAEIGLSLLVLLALLIIADLSTSSGYNREAASGFFIGFFALWAVASFLLALLVVGHLGIATISVHERGDWAAVVDHLPRLVVEFGLAATLVLVGPMAIETTAHYAATRVLAMAVIIHGIVDAGRIVRTLID